MGSFPTDAPQVVVKLRCPALRNYKAELIQKSGAELRRLRAADPAAATPSLVADYQLLRAQCRAFAK
jgi:hypothetical protein